MLEKKLHVWKKRTHTCAQVYMRVQAPARQSGGGMYPAKRPFSLGKPPFHTARYLYWTLPWLCLLVLWLVSQECTGTNLSFSTRCSLGTLGKRKSLSLGLQGPCRENLYKDEATQRLVDVTEGQSSDFIIVPTLMDVSMPDLAKLGFPLLS